MSLRVAPSPPSRLVQASAARVGGDRPWARQGPERQRIVSATCDSAQPQYSVPRVEQGNYKTQRGIFRLGYMPYRQSMVWSGWGEHGEGHRVRRPLAASHRRRILAIHGAFVKTDRKRMQIATRCGWLSAQLLSGGSEQKHRTTRGVAGGQGGDAAPPGIGQDTGDKNRLGWCPDFVY